MATTGSDRIVTLDIIRGVAVMGIFSVNVVAFAMDEASYFNPSALGQVHGASLFVWAANMLLIDGKMRALFSMLFGASTLLVIDRAVAAGKSGWSVHWRRMAVLLLFGMIHFFFIWPGDILTMYALGGFLIYRARYLPARKLAVRGMVLIAFSTILFATFSVKMVQSDAAAHVAHPTAAAIADWRDNAGQFYPTAKDIADDARVHLGSYGKLTFDRLQHWGELVGSSLFPLAETVGLMLIGMAAFRSGLLTGEWSDERYRKWAIVGLSIGVVAHALVVAAELETNFGVAALMGGFFAAMSPFRPIMALGYAALIILLTRRRGWLSMRIAAAGRCAFTNYLGTSILASALFNGWGLGLYDRLDRVEAWLVAPAFWLIMLAWSKPWLDRFHYGPFEWLWRSLSRGKLQPMRKKSSLPQVGRGTASAAGGGGA